ncbi:CRISPR-associated endonuclease Cas2 [Candidatus Accumulibacter contiguus]|jgi:CRISPR-associated protein Cas2|uniref:CRISPR-associated endonuclease Cas2 n=1 Tax=Candidatus Accumulibacter contiguus TaxID=2954381 RepID=UPI002FC398AD
MSDAARTLYLVCYDVCEPKRLRRVHKYPDRLQGRRPEIVLRVLADRGRTARGAQTRWPNCSISEEDRAHIFQLDPRMPRDCWAGRRQPVTDVFLIV